MSIVSGIYLGKFLKTQDLIPMEGCSSDSECSWMIVNCCPEVAGAMWECVDLNYYKKADCPKTVICPQVISLKPSKDCICKNGSCEVE
jgi:hypothetical protein